MLVISTASGLWISIILSILVLVFSNTRQGWRIATRLSGINVLLAIFLFSQIFNSPVMSAVLRLDFLHATLLLLINFLAWIIYRYSAVNFQADVDAPRFLTWLTCTLLAVQVLILSDHLIVFWLAWVGVSLSLHKLLTFYPNRPRAILAAHKKFLIARCSELCLGLSFWLIYSVHHSFSISHILSQYPLINLPWQITSAVILLALVALLKCAQLPLHGWLIQVVESPTSVSALLHAGVINLGGVLLLIFAPLLSQVAAAQWLLLLIAGPSAVLAALTMTTRISIKVRLAWSTCAQMGLMLVECALGLYELALLHLIAHSFYKAQAFLSSGSAVREYLHAQMAQAAEIKQVPSIRRWILASVIILASMAGVATLLNGLFADHLQANIHLFSIAPWLVIGFALLSFVAYQLNVHQSTCQSKYLSPLKSMAQLKNLVTVITTVVLLISLYVLLKTQMAQLLDLPIYHSSWLADVWVCALVILLIAANYALQNHAQNAQVRSAWIALNAGVYLDEWITRLTLYWLPIKLTSHNALSGNTTSTTAPLEQSITSSFQHQVKS